MRKRKFSRFFVRAPEDALEKVSFVETDPAEEDERPGGAPVRRACASDLPIDVLTLLLSRRMLGGTPSELLRMGRVCRAWHEAVWRNCEFSVYLYPTRIGMGSTYALERARVATIRKTSHLLYLLQATQLRSLRMPMLKGRVSMHDELRIAMAAVPGYLGLLTHLCLGTVKFGGGIESSLPLLGDRLRVLDLALSGLDSGFVLTALTRLDRLNLMWPTEGARELILLPQSCTRMTLVTSAGPEHPLEHLTQLRRLDLYRTDPDPAPRRFEPRLPAQLDALLLYHGNTAMQDFCLTRLSMLRKFTASGVVVDLGAGCRLERLTVDRGEVLLSARMGRLSRVESNVGISCHATPGCLSGLTDLTLEIRRADVSQASGWIRTALKLPVLRRLTLAWHWASDRAERQTYDAHWLRRELEGGRWSDPFLRQLMDPFAAHGKLLYDSKYLSSQLATDVVASPRRVFQKFGCPL